jgi:phosphoglycerate dehydrogenase-like enzyme
VNGRRPVVVALGAVDPTLATEVLGDRIQFVAQPGPEDLANAEGAIVRADAVVDGALLARAPRLRVLARTGVGVDLVDLEEASARGIAVVITPGAGTRAVAEGVLAHALHLVKRLAPLTRLVREGRWAERAGVAVGDLDGATIGIIGYGRIGRRVGELAAAFGMRVLAHDPISPPPADVDRPDLGELAEASDVLTLHAPLTAATYHLVDARLLGRVRPGRSSSTADAGACSTWTPPSPPWTLDGWAGSAWTSSTPNHPPTTPCSTTPTSSSPPP